MHDSMKTGFLYYKSEIQAQMLLESATFARGYLFKYLYKC
ncbi:hypothetical protein T01_3418 [Trichinella spiralis]|uniref:Uncharacterized protein n=1 Tax=Trichinella spiralis TaxID=6334 RepID=A0A0V0YZ74_TRISP|nr:hypothetical protein T01_3418 [Trichinella spiralis]